MRAWSATALLLLAGCSLLIDPDGVPAPKEPNGARVPRFAYVANFDGTVSMYTVDAGTGRLRANGYVPTASASTAGIVPAVAVDPLGRYAFVATGDASGTTLPVSAYRIDAATGRLTSAGGAGAAGDVPTSIVVDPSGRFAYAPSAGPAA